MERARHASAFFTDFTHDPCSRSRHRLLAVTARAELHAKAIVLKQNGTKAALVAWDLLKLPRHGIELLVKTFRPRPPHRTVTRPSPN